MSNPTNPTNTHKTSAEIMRAYSNIAEAKHDMHYDEDGNPSVDGEYDAVGKHIGTVDDVQKKFRDEKPANVKESAHDFFTRYADLLKESNDDEDEDPDVAIADKEKGKDKKTQKETEKKLPPWLQKKDEADENKGVKKAKKDKDL